MPLPWNRPAHSFDKSERHQGFLSALHDALDYTGTFRKLELAIIAEALPAKILGVDRRNRFLARREAIRNVGRQPTQTHKPSTHHAALFRSCGCFDGCP
ncbi:MAG: hypothetical protein DCC74_10480 [Proteobacteria bacterium]|nr:MAG: hypothetical protein DCC74_10480 [Pseudomonadota bacterium]